MDKMRYILLVEDNDVDAFISSTVLGRVNGAEHYEIIRCYNGKEAYKYLLDETNKYPDIILLDLNMPVMDGKEFLIERTKYTLLGDIPVVVLTSSYLKRDREISHAYGIKKYIEKPLDDKKSEEIIQLINHQRAS